VFAAAPVLWALAANASGLLAKPEPDSGFQERGRVSASAARRLDPASCGRVQGQQRIDNLDRRLGRKVINAQPAHPAPALARARASSFSTPGSGLT
jgi:hypothetical protein